MVPRRRSGALLCAALGLGAAASTQEAWELELEALPPLADAFSWNGNPPPPPPRPHATASATQWQPPQPPPGASVAFGGSSGKHDIPDRRPQRAPPEVCLAFLSCCGRTDLLEKTLAAAVRHMERDEPTVAYEVAWVDNGSSGASGGGGGGGGDGHAASLAAAWAAHPAAPLEHVRLEAENKGLAWGLNELFFGADDDDDTDGGVSGGGGGCSAPFVLILEEDWMYMDGAVAEQTPERRHAVGRALEVARSGATSFDGRALLGAFLRPETYDTFLVPPHAGPWQATPGGVEFRTYCADVTGGSGYLWGSYTNGAGLYDRALLRDRVGRMFGEPGDGFHDSYVVTQ